MDFGFSEEQDELRAAVRDYLSREFPISFARQSVESGAAFSREAWRGLCGLGWTGLAVPEELGGSGLSLLDLTLALEEAGSVAMPGPFVSTVSLAVPLLLAAANEYQCATLIPEIVSGERLVACAIAEKAGRWSGDSIQASARPDGAGFVLNGLKMFVPDADAADTIVVATRLDGGLGFFAIPSDTPGLVVSAMRTVDATRSLATVSLSEVRVADACLLGGKPLREDELDAVVDHAKVALAAQMVGAADRVLAMTVEYVELREQFGRTIATFQAVQHRCADMKVAVEHARSLVYYAAWACDTLAPDRHLAAAMAKAFASDACPSVAADAVQLHGGIGFTWEHDLHIYFKRLKADEQTYGGATVNRELVARLLEDAA